jgi:hypothetical protein
MDNTNRGTIAKNTRKTQDTHPDIAGSINVEGKEYWLNGWQKTNSQDGSKFYSLSVKPKEERQPAASYSQDKSQRRVRPAPAFELQEEPTDDDEIPF